MTDLFVFKVIFDLRRAMVFSLSDSEFNIWINNRVRDPGDVAAVFLFRLSVGIVIFIFICSILIWIIMQKIYSMAAPIDVSGQEKSEVASLIH